MRAGAQAAVAVAARRARGRAAPAGALRRTGCGRGDRRLDQSRHGWAVPRGLSCAVLLFWSVVGAVGLAARITGPLSYRLWAYDDIGAHFTVSKEAAHRPT